MNIVYILPPSITQVNSGIKKQAEIWRDGLLADGHKVIEFTSWNIPNWESIDLIHIFGNGLWIIETINSLKYLNIPIVISPIIDTYKSVFVYRIVSYLGCPKIRLYSSNYALRYVKDNISGVLVRSEHEKKYVVGAYGYSKNRIHMLRLPCRIAKKEENVIYKKKEYCLHVSTFTQKRKNVMSLIEAAIKFKFNLKIAGNPGTLNDRKPFYKIASEHDNVEILGPVSEDELLKLYDEAKVFALPSLDEGVGFVALEAASRGCNIVITSLGGPKEYYQGMAQIVNPYSIDSIGKGVLKAMSQPSNVDLKNLINNEYNLEENIHQLLEIYTKVLESFRKCPLLTSISIP